MSTEFKTEPTIIPVALPEESTYAYVAVKGFLQSTDCDVYGLNEEEILALAKRYEVPKNNMKVTGVNLKGGCISVINSLAELGYRVITSTGENEITWTLQREI